MKYYKSQTGEVFAFEEDGSQDEYITEDLVLMTEQEVYEHLHPTPTQEQYLEWANSELAQLQRQANAQVTALQGRVSTLNDPDMEGMYTDEEIAELPVRQAQLKAWKNYRLLLGRVPTQAKWPAAPEWPVMPEPYTNETSAVSVPTA